MAAVLVTDKHCTGSFTYTIPDGIWQNCVVEGHYDFNQNKELPICDLHMTSSDGVWMSASVADNKQVTMQGTSIEYVNDFASVIDAVYTQLKALPVTY